MNDPTHRPEPHHDGTVEDPNKRVRSLWQREGTRILLGVIGFLGAYAWYGLNQNVSEIKRNQDKSNSVALEQTMATTRLDGKVTVLTTRIDEGVIRQVNENAKLLQDHETRIRSLERKTPIP